VDRPLDARERELTKGKCFALLAGQRLDRLAFTDERGPGASARIHGGQPALIGICSSRAWPQRKQTACLT
jgi:hypothetical protein